MFKITDYVEFDNKGRAICPCCALEGKTRGKNLALIPNTDGAYKCHRGCTPQQIRDVLGSPKTAIVPSALAQAKPPAGSYSVTVSPKKVKEAHDRLVESNGPAKEWLHQRGITDELIARYQLGIVRAKVGDRHLPAISIPLPNADGTAYYQKKRISPWPSDAHRMPEYKPWSQAGIPARVWFTYLPAEATSTWLCEGEWDAMLLGWQVRQADLPVAVATFTAGCGTLPPKEQLDLLPGTVISWYDRNDKPLKDGKIPGDEGARKLAAALGDRGRIGSVPMPENCNIHGWDVSDALNNGYTVQDFLTAAAQATAIAPPTKGDNPLKKRLLSNAELIASAPDYVEFLIPDLLPANELILVAGPPRGGKSLLAMLLAKCVATGDNFLDRPVTQGSVLYVCCEDAPVKVKQRQLAQGWEADIPVYWLDRFKLSQFAELRELAEELDCRLIVLDTLSRVRDDGVSESSAEMSRVLEPLQELAEDLGCCILLVHHTNKISVENAGNQDVFDTIRGSSAIRATCRGTLVLAADNDCYRLCAENGYGKYDLRIRLDQTTLEWKLMGRWQETISSDQRSQVEDYLNKVGQATLDQIFEATQIPKASLYKVLSRLAKDNFLTREGHRRSVLYTRSSDLIRLSDDLSDDANPDRESVRGTYLTKNNFPISEKGDQSDHPTHAKDDHFSQNDHFSDTPHTGDILSDRGSNASPVSVWSSDKSSDKSDLSDESGEVINQNPMITPLKLSDHPPKNGDRIFVLTEDGWKKGTYAKPADGSYVSRSTGKLDESHWVFVSRRRRKVAASDIRLADEEE